MIVGKSSGNRLQRTRIKKWVFLAGLGLTAWLLSACGYPTPQGGGALTPYVVVVTPTSLPRTDTPIPPSTAPTISPTNTPSSPAALQATIPPNTAAPTPKVTPTLAVVGNEYTVQAGDTLWGISIRLKVDYEDLLDFNKIDDPNKLQIGQVLKIPPRPSSGSNPTSKPKG
jgi:LysM repeat protein